MNGRINEGYTITDSIHIGKMEFVLGKNSSDIPMYVTWACRDDDNYFWGHYFGDLMEAKKDLLDRAGKELEYQMLRQKQVGEKPRGKETKTEIER